VQWVWTYLTGQRGARLIVNHHGPVPADSPATGAEVASSIHFRESS